MEDHDYYVDKQLGSYFVLRQQWEKALNYSGKAKAYVPKEAKVLGAVAGYHRNDAKISLNHVTCYRNLCKNHSALHEIEEALENGVSNVDLKLEHCKTLYELNRIEEALVDVLNCQRFYDGKSQKPFVNLQHAITQNLKDILGEAFEKFSTENFGTFVHIWEQMKKEKIIDERPEWKQRRDNKECDVMSIREKEIILKSPCALAKKEETERIFYQTYFGTSWKDVMFYKGLSKDTNMVIENFVESAPRLAELVAKFSKVAKNVRILHARSPMYIEKLKRCPDPKRCKQKKEEFLYIKQYRTRRMVSSILKKAKQLRAEGNLLGLRKYLKEVMFKDILCKTHRLLPWKFEFVNEVYNLLALTFTDKCLVPLKYKSKGMKRLLETLGLKISHGVTAAPQVNPLERNAFEQREFKTKDLKAEQQYVSHMEAHIFHSKYSIEKCALNHELGLHFLNEHRQGETLYYARKVLEEAQKCNSSIWQFLGTIVIAKSHVMYNKIELAQEELKKAYTIAMNAKDIKLVTFTQTCMADVQKELDWLDRKRRETASTLSKRRSPTKSATSRSSILSSSGSFSSIAIRNENASEGS